VAVDPTFLVTLLELNFQSSDRFANCSTDKAAAANMTCQRTEKQLTEQVQVFMDRTVNMLHQVMDQTENMLHQVMDRTVNMLHQAVVLLDLRVDTTTKHQQPSNKLSQVVAMTMPQQFTTKHLNKAMDLLPLFNKLSQAVAMITRQQFIIQHLNRTMVHHHNLKTLTFPLRQAVGTAPIAMSVKAVDQHQSQVHQVVVIKVHQVVVIKVHQVVVLTLDESYNSRPAFH
jgi:hypothetical protein